MNTKALIKKAFDKAFAKYDVIVAPAAPTTAPELGKSLSDPIKMYLGDIYTISVNLAGLPGISIPVGKDSKGLPVGMQLIGDCFEEKKSSRQHIHLNRRKVYEAPELAKEGQIVMAKQYETVIGLEVHVELATKTKIFCGCSTAFGGAPNTHTCPVCTGMPGSLPVLNKQVVEYAMGIGLATHCDITQCANSTVRTIFIRITHRTIRFHSYICQSARNGYVEMKLVIREKKSPYP